MFQVWWVFKMLPFRMFESSSEEDTQGVGMGLVL